MWQINREARGVLPGVPLPFMSRSCPCASQVLVQGCLLEPSQQEVFLQQVYAQLCLFEDKVATMLQQQYDRQNQVCGRKAGRGRLEGGAVKGQRKDKPNVIEGRDSRKTGLKARGRGRQGKKCQ